MKGVWYPPLKGCYPGVCISIQLVYFVILFTLCIKNIILESDTVAKEIHCKQHHLIFFLEVCVLIVIWLRGNNGTYSQWTMDATWLIICRKVLHIREFFWLSYFPMSLTFMKMKSLFIMDLTPNQIVIHINKVYVCTI